MAHEPNDCSPTNSGPGHVEDRGYVRVVAAPVKTRSEPRGETPREERGQQGRTLRSEEKVRLALLALPTFALALSITVVSTYLSEVTRHYTRQTTVIGVIIGGEGVMALWVPLIAGAWSDQLRSRIGGRLPFVLAGTIPAAVALALIGFMHSLGLVALVAAVFFGFYFVAYEPYRAMYPDLLDEEEVAGRAQSTQALARGVGTGLALLGGGLLLSIAKPLPFVAAAIILSAAVAAFVVVTLRRGLAGQEPTNERASEHGPMHVFRRLPKLLKEHRALRAYLIANALWEMALSALKAFVILYLTIGLHYKLAVASLIIGAVALVILIGAAAAGKAGDKFGAVRVVTPALWAYGCGYLVLIFTTSRPLIIAAVPFIALGGGAVMTLAYAILMPLMPDDEHGALTGFYSLSRGVGIIAGPILAGVAISLTGNSLFSGTQGFQAMWIVCAAAAFSSILFVHRLRGSDQDRRELERH
jgi:Na+/melibiose symporter-like transporter